jgi:allophanate hydrolase subunit 2
MDALAFSAANIMAGNSPRTEAFEIVSGVSIKFHFYIETVVAVTGRNGVVVKVNGKEVGMWAKVIIPSGGQLEILGGGSGNGLRVYLAVRGGLVEVPKYLGSKSTSMGLGGYQVRMTAVSVSCV